MCAWVWELRHVLGYRISSSRCPGRALCSNPHIEPSKKLILMVETAVLKLYYLDSLRVLL